MRRFLLHTIGSVVHSNQCRVQSSELGAQHTNICAILCAASSVLNPSGCLEAKNDAYAPGELITSHVWYESDKQMPMLPSGRWLLHEFRFDFHGALNVALQCCPAVLYASAGAACQLDQVLVEPLLLDSFNLLFPLHCTGPGLQALLLYLGLSYNDLSICASFVESWQRIGKRFEGRNKLLIRSPSLLSFRRRLLDFGDKRRVLNLLLVFLRRGKERLGVV